MSMHEHGKSALAAELLRAARRLPHGDPLLGLNGTRAEDWFELLEPVGPVALVGLLGAAWRGDVTDINSAAVALDLGASVADFIEAESWFASHGRGALRPYFRWELRGGWLSGQDDRRRFLDLAGRIHALFGGGAAPVAPDLAALVGLAVRRQFRGWRERAGDRVAWEGPCTARCATGQACRGEATIILSPRVDEVCVVPFRVPGSSRAIFVPARGRVGRSFLVSAGGRSAHPLVIFDENGRGVSAAHAVDPHAGCVMIDFAIPALDRDPSSLSCGRAEG
ncbi:MAG: hypothetical protein FJ102_07630 [Deltaproteobacteria bacterium]|nr:hypothetical protein [Deltaproteobacteria bacterium]